MAFPYLFSENFELGTFGQFNAESDTDNIIDIAHYTELARFGLAPYRGAYCARIRAGSGTNSAFYREDEGFDAAASARLTVRFYFYLDADFTMADGDKFSLYEAESTLNTTTEIAAGLDRSGTDLRVWFAETQAAATVRTRVLGDITAAYRSGRSPLGQWHHLEIDATIDAGGGNDGTLDGWVDDTSIGAQITGLDQAAIVDAKIGIIGKEAGTTGTILIDQVIADNGRIFMDRERFPRNRWVHAPQDHPIIGPGRFSAAVTGTGTNAVLSLYDADWAPDRLEPIAVIRNLTANEFVPGHDVFEVSRGLYCTLTGTDVQAFFSIDRGGFTSPAALIAHAERARKPRP